MEKLIAKIDCGDGDHYDLRECGHEGYKGAYYSIWHNGRETIITARISFANALFHEFLHDEDYWESKGGHPNVFDLTYIEYRGGGNVSYKLN